MKLDKNSIKVGDYITVTKWLLIKDQSYVGDVLKVLATSGDNIHVFVDKHGGVKTTLSLNEVDVELLADDYVNSVLCVSKYKTKPIDYTGCNLIIAEHLKSGESVLCWLKRHVDDKPAKGYIISYIRDADYPYMTKGNSWPHAEPIEQPQTETRVKKASELVKWFEDEGWNRNNVQWWKFENGNELFFNFEMLNLCGKKAPDNVVLLPEWIEEVEVDNG